MKVNNIDKWREILMHFEDKDVTITVKKITKKRTTQQNRALYLYFTLLAEALNDSGYDMKAVIRKEVDIPWTSETVKSHLWKPIQKDFLKQYSTTELTTKQIDEVYDVVNRVVGERTGVHIPFPSIESLMQ